MKYFSIVIIILTFSLNSLGQSRKHQIEIILLDCLIENYKSKGVDLSKELDNLEKYLVKNKFLKSSSGQSYYDFYKKIAQLNDIPATIDYSNSSLEGIYKLTPTQFYTMECLEQLKSIDSTVIVESKYYQLKIKIEQSSADGTTPSNIASAIINTLSPSNFKIPYYRAVALLAIANTSNSSKENAILNNSNEDFSNYKRIFVLTNDKNEIIIDGNTINQEEFKMTIRNFIRKNKSNHLIEFKADRDTSYAFYLSIKNIVSEVYNDLREELAMEKFKKKFDELTVSKQEKIIKIYPIQVKE